MARIVPPLGPLLLLAMIGHTGTAGLSNLTFSVLTLSEKAP